MTSVPTPTEIPTMNDAKELAVILSAITIAFGLIAGGVMLHPTKPVEAAVVMWLAIAFSAGGAVGAIALLKRTKPIDRRHF